MPDVMIIRRLREFIVANNDRMSSRLTLTCDTPHILQCRVAKQSGKRPGNRAHVALPSL